MEIRKTILPVAGLGTRLLSVTKELPKEMLGVFAKEKNGNRYFRPLTELIFEQLFDVGFRDYYFVVGRGKRALQDHFTPDLGYVIMLKNKNRHDYASVLERFYEKRNNSNVVWVDQHEPKGFGDAVLKVKPHINEPHLVHAGDTYIVSNNHDHLRRLLECYERFKADAVLLLQEIENPKQYGIAEVSDSKQNIYKVLSVEEKPEKPKTNLAIMPIYIFDPIIFKALEKVEPGKEGEIQLTDGIQRLIDWGMKVFAIKLYSNEVRLDIGSTETYWDALNKSYELL